MQRLKIEDAAHFSFLLLCKPGAVAILEADHPGDKVVCEDGGGRDRAALHGQMTGDVIRFLAAALKPR